tara:strand:- start:757 stop:1236 length:480 start_codon:yes stop_codon:yes gene_type:complete
MKLALLLLIIFNQSVIAWSLFGYSSYSECMKEEIKDNDGKENSFIRNYCRDEFPIKTTPKVPEVPMYKKWDDYKAMPFEEYDIESTNGEITLTNKSIEKTMVMLRVYYYHSDGPCDSDLKIKKEGYNYRDVKVGPGQKKTYYFFKGNNAPCFKYSVKFN